MYRECDAAYLEKKVEITEEDQVDAIKTMLDIVYPFACELNGKNSVVKLKCGTAENLVLIAPANLSTMKFIGSWSDKLRPIKLRSLI